MLEYMKFWAAKYMLDALCVAALLFICFLLGFASTVIATIDFYWSKVKRIFRRGHAN